MKRCGSLQPPGKGCNVHARIEYESCCRTKKIGVRTAARRKKGNGEGEELRLSPRFSGRRARDEGSLSLKKSRNQALRDGVFQKTRDG